MILEIIRNTNPNPVSFAPFSEMENNRNKLTNYLSHLAFCINGVFNKKCHTTKLHYIGASNKQIAIMLSENKIKCTENEMSSAEFLALKKAATYYNLLNQIVSTKNSPQLKNIDNYTKDINRLISSLQSSSDNVDIKELFLQAI